MKYDELTYKVFAYTLFYETTYPLVDDSLYAIADINGAAWDAYYEEGEHQLKIPLLSPSKQQTQPIKN